MKKSKFTEDQITYALRQAEIGTPVADVYRQLSISEASFQVWKKKYAKLSLTDLRELRKLRDENARLNRVVADLTLEKHIFSEVVPQPTVPGERWSMDFARDQKLHGLPFRMLTVVDQVSRESLLIGVDSLLAGHKVAAASERCLGERGADTWSSNSVKGVTFF